MNETYVIAADRGQSSIMAWDAASGTQLRRMAGAHNMPISDLATSPTDMTFVSCSDDMRAKYWVAT